MKFRIINNVIFLFLFKATVAFSSEKNEFFEKKIRPVLVQHCYECHNSLGKKKGGLALDYKAALLAGGDSGKVIVPGKAKESILIWALRHEEGYEMPAKSPKLDDAVIRDFEHWVNQGAHDPRLTKPTLDDLNKKLPWEQLRNQRLTWWSFQPLKNPPIPNVSAKAWSKNSIDRFIFARLQHEHLPASSEASPEVLVRRLHLILTGLPPKPEVVQEFVKNYSLQTYEQLVDDLLASPQFGERWARHWMDWYRYAETHGSEGDPPIPYASAYRDYLIRALNADVPYDQLLKEHLAGDLLKDPRVNQELGINESTIGPAHLRMVPHGFGVTNAYAEQITFTDNQIDVISKAMLGITVSCARCHDHKFDPISQKDFYRFFGVMVSNKPATVLIDTREKLDANKTEITKIKQEIRQELANFWIGESEKLSTRLQTLPIFKELAERKNPPKLPANFGTLKKNEQNKVRQQFEAEQAKWNLVNSMRSVTHPFGLWSGLQSVKPEAYSTTINQQRTKLKEIKEQNQKAITNAEFYLDLRDQATFDQWYSTGNGTTAQVSPAGSFALHFDGEKAIAGIFPRGIYSHLISDKHAAVLSSGNFIAKGEKTMVRVAGNSARLKVPIRNYPLTHGGLHPAEDVNNLTLQWRNTQRKWKYWRGDQVHYELLTAKDFLPIPRTNDRSWFGITEVYAGNDTMQEEGASLLDLIDNSHEIVNQESLIRAYVGMLKQAITHWQAGNMSDKEAEWLDTFVRLDLLTNQVGQFPPSLQMKIDRYRELEKAIPVPRRAPGILESEPVDQPLLIRGEQKQESDPVKRKFLEIFNDQSYSDKNSGRLQLAEDMVSEANTLKTRVLINRLWAYVFGRGIVASTDNFGRLGKKPTHPELLDHLALDFERNGWSIKKALRKMVTSRTFRSASQTSLKMREKDAENLFLSYYTPRRLDAESIFDSIHFVTEGNQRAIYLPVVRNRLNPFLQAFNAPVPTSTVSVRSNTNVPSQSLAMLNGAVVEKAAKAWVKRIQQDKNLNTLAEKINAMFIQAYARPATSAELKLFIEYLQSGGSDYHIAHALLNSKEFIYVY
ncbi:PSD1 and planctomycete cytochrome C domain-containing protein [Gimesia aquarii]|uniref:Planctomycete cytochrome C n=1 Tax=Gimesia aquarii TaxID=2527964 RepID=A0A517VZK5_9PLAN|nr:PSD1 and planctomycete cytochrome C domain-containing protein [Gimesia aquarii]QDT98429.1 Planctomycete cytochrome C [Gimesia aquarii]